MANHNDYKLKNTWSGYFISQYLVAKPHACTNAWILFGINQGLSAFKNNCDGICVNCPAVHIIWINA